MDVNAMQFPQVYQQLGIDVGNLGCIMLDTEPLTVNDVIPESELYSSDEHQYVDGIVSETVPHVTLLYGLLSSGPLMMPHVDQVLSGWTPEDLTIESVSSFPSHDPAELYVCIIAKLTVTPNLIEGNGRLRFLPHIDTFIQYTPHITLAYVKADDEAVNQAVYALNERFAGKQVKVTGINYGD